MTDLPPIKVTSLDLQRLNTLLDCVSDLSHPGAPRLRQELMRAEIVAPEALPFDVVSMNSRVHFRDCASGEELEYSLCYPADVEGYADRVSILEPLGSALLGLAVGQAITWPLGGSGLLELEIIEVTYQPERVGEFDR